MKRCWYLVDDQSTLNEVVRAIETDGYTIDPDLKIVRLENAAIYHLVKYSEEELQAQEVEEEQRIMSIKSVNIEDADELLDQGYEVKDTYAKTVTVIKKEKLERAR